MGNPNKLNVHATNRSIVLNAGVRPRILSLLAVIEALIPSLLIAFGVVGGIDFLQHSW
jgi:hypothetical protein